MVDRILSQALKKAQSAEVIYEEGESQGAEFENNVLKYVNNKNFRGVGVRVICDGRIGFSSTTDMEAIDRTVTSALESAKFGEKAQFEFPGRAAFPDVKVFDPAVSDYTIDEAVRAGKEAIAHVLDAYPDVKCSAEIDKATSTVRLANSNGLDVSCECSEIGGYIEAFRLMGESFLSAGDGNSYRNLRLEMNKHADRTVELVRQAEKEVTVAPGPYTVIFSPRAARALLGGFIEGINGKMVQKGVSPLTGKLNEKVLGEAFTMIDDSTIDYAEGSEPCDGEGIPSRRTPLFEKGVLKNYLLDLQTAGLLGMEPTGNASRSYASQPRPGTSNLIIGEGGMPYDDMLSRGGKTILIERLLGAGQSNTLAGEFSGNIYLGFLVEKGEIIGRVKNCMVAGNAYESFNSIGAISQETEWRGALCIPAFLFENMTIASRE